MSSTGTGTLSNLLKALRKERGLPAAAPKASPLPTGRKPRLKRLSARSRLADNPTARTAAEAFRDAMKGSK